MKQITILLKGVVHGLRVLVKHLNWMMEDMCAAIQQFWLGNDE